MDQNLIEKLRKILALTTSPVEGEAQAAAAMLAKLLAAHNLDIADLEKKGQAAPGVREQAHDLGKAAFTWKLNLAEGIADFYYCVPMVDSKKKTVAFIGRPDNVDTLQMLYGWVIEQIKQIATKERRKHFDTTGEHIDPLRWQVNFGIGAVQRLVVRLTEMKARQQEEMSTNEFGDVTALALHHQSEASDYIEAKYGYRKDGKRTRRDQEWYERYEAQLAAKEDMRVRCEAAGDMTEYYRCYPNETPEAKKAAEERQEKWNKEWEKKEARNAKRRTGRTRERQWTEEDERRDDQGYRARSSGRAAGDQINLQPFIKGAQRKGEIE